MVKPKAILERLEPDERVLFHLKQKLQCELFSILAVFLLPISMLTLSNSNTGRLVAIIFY